MRLTSQSATAPHFHTDDERWAAVARRDKRAARAFFYCVLSTGIYCRPGCPSRLAHRQNVRFHLTAAAAEADGFRPCKRCRPGDSGHVSAGAAAVARACQLLDCTADTPSLAELAAAVNLSPWHFHRVFRATTGLTPRAYAAARRGLRVKKTLLERETITDALYRAGYGSSSAFYKDTTKNLGMTPRTFRSRGCGETIQYAVTRCALGHALIAATDKGVCDIALGNDAATLVRDLRDRYAGAMLTRADRRLRGWIARVVQLIEEPDEALDLPLDIRGTAFQRRVWQALSAVPPGSTVSYRELAERLGIPQSVRAVARACASNPLAVAIPCHRAVRGDGQLAGYRWGIARKERLLEIEKAALGRSRGKR